MSLSQAAPGAFIFRSHIFATITASNVSELVPGCYPDTNGLADDPSMPRNKLCLP